MERRVTGRHGRVTGRMVDTEGECERSGVRGAARVTRRW